MTNTAYNMDGLAKEVRAVYEALAAEWIAEGRSEEQIHGVRNFFSGKGPKLEEQLLSLCRKERAKEWDVIHETLHSSSLIMQEHINKVMTDRISELRSKS